MDRRSFLVRLAAAAAGVAAIGLVDPERLLWTPGAKKILDLGAGRQVVPATDTEVLDLASIHRASPFDLRTALATARPVHHEHRLDLGPRDIRLEIFDSERQELRAFRYKDDRLVGRYVKADLELLQQPFVGRKGVR